MYVLNRKRRSWGKGPGRPGRPEGPVVPYSVGRSYVSLPGSALLKGESHLYPERQDLLHFPHKTFSSCPGPEKWPQNVPLRDPEPRRQSLQDPNVLLVPV